MKTTVFLNRKKTNANGEHPVWIRLAKKDKIKYVSLGVSLPGINWDDDKNRFKGDEESFSEVLQKINEERKKYSDKIEELRRSKKDVSLDTFVDMVRNPKPLKRDITVLAYFKELYEAFRSQGKIGNYRVYLQTYNALSDYLNEKHGKGKKIYKPGKKKDHSDDHDITFSEIDVRFLNEFDRYLRKGHDDQKRRQGTISVYLRTLRALYNRAISEEIAKEEEYPFRKSATDTKRYKVPGGNNNKRALSQAETNRLLKLNIDSDYYRYMVFSYHCIGLNFVDLANLKWSNIHDGILTYTRTKLVHHGNDVGIVEIPLNEEALNILNHYRPMTGIDKTNFIFPIIDKYVHVTPQQQDDRRRKVLRSMNEELKRFTELANLSIPLTSYVIRHTIISELIRKGVHLDIVRVLAGHMDINTTMLYNAGPSMKDKQSAIKKIS